MRISAAFVLVLVLSGCGGTKDYLVQPPLSVEPAKTQIPGKYAVLLLPRQIPMQAGFGGYSCSAWKFNFDTTQAFSMGAKTFLSTAFFAVQYVNHPLSPSELSRNGYSGQVTLTEGPASARSHTIGYTAHTTAHAEVNLSVLLANGTGFHQDGIFGESEPDSALGLCGSMGDSMSTALTSALKTALQKSVTALSDRLRPPSR